ncbi:MAG: DUF2285 domain-containing protein [Jhaorihella sp.]
MPPGRAPLFWAPRARPQAIILSPLVRGGETGRAVMLSALVGVELRQAADGWHGIWRADGATHQFWLPDTQPDAAVPYTAQLPMDAFFELRAYAARRLWRALNGRSPGPAYHPMPDQLRNWHILTLRALDARAGGASYRDIAADILGFQGAKEDFEIDPRKNQARRLVAHGTGMLNGGYRQLLHYPIKAPKRR